MQTAHKCNLSKNHTYTTNWTLILVLR